MVYLRARHYAPSLGLFPSLDPFEGIVDISGTLNGYNYVAGNPLNDGVGELIFHNRYSYAGANPVNRVDPSGMCWVNPSTSPDQQTQCYDAWLVYTNIVTNVHTQNWPRDIRVLMTQEARYWANLPYSQFVSQWNSSRHPTSNDSSGQILGIGLPIASGISQADSPLPGPADLLAVLAGLCVVGIAAIVNTNAVTLPLRPAYSFSGQIYEYRLTGFDAKVGTLAEHLAKLLERDVAGYPPSDPNPNRDPDGGWCRTIRRVIQEIDGAGYSERQLNRDLEAAGFAGTKWSEIISAVRKVIELRLCDDHWGDFGGGSLAAG